MKELKELIAQLEFIRSQAGKSEVEIMGAFAFMYPEYLLDIDEGLATLYNKTGVYSFPLEDIPNLLKRFSKHYSKAGKMRAKKVPWNSRNTSIQEAFKEGSTSKLSACNCRPQHFRAKKGPGLKINP